jgi:hypothetical protein
MLKKVNRIAGGAPGVQTKHTQAGAIIDGGILKRPAMTFIVST